MGEVALPAEKALLDGEAICLRHDGSNRFHGLRSTFGAASACLIAFDLIELDGEDLRKHPLEARRYRLTEILAGGPDGITANEQFWGDGATVFRHVEKLGLEGIVSKRLGSPYVSGRCGHWVKTRSPSYERD